MIKIKDKKVYKNLIKESKEFHKGKIKDDVGLNELLQHQKERLIFYLILFSIILLVLVLYWIFKK